VARPAGSAVATPAVNGSAARTARRSQISARAPWLGSTSGSTGLWETISGRVERDEDPLDAVRREIAEESGLEVRIDPRPITAYAARRADVPMLVIVYRAEHVAGEVVRSDEHDEHAWLTADELAERSPLAKLVAAVRACLADVRKVRGRSP